MKSKMDWVWVCYWLGLIGQLQPSWLWGEEVLALLERGELALKMTARDAYQVNLELTNRTTTPLQVEFPAGLVADAWAQQPLLFQIGGSGAGSIGQGLAFLESPTINVPGETPVLASIRTACMNYGVPEPSAETPLFLKTVADYTPDFRVHATLKQIVQQQANTGAAQAALWRFTNELSWEKLNTLASQPGLKLDRQDLPAAQHLVQLAEVAEQRRQSELAQHPDEERRLPMTIAINPDPRSPQLPDQLIRNVAQELRQRWPGATVNYANFPPLRPTTTVDKQYEVMVRMLPEKKNQVMIAYRAGAWHTVQQKWVFGKPMQDYLNIPAESRAKPTDSPAWTNWLTEQLQQSLANTALTVRRIGKSRQQQEQLEISNLLPIAVYQVQIQPLRTPEVVLDLSDHIIAPDTKTVLALTEEQSAQISSFRKFQVIRFTPCLSEKPSANLSTQP